MNSLGAAATVGGLLLVVACGGGEQAHRAGGSGGTGNFGNTGGLPPLDELGGADCPGLSCLACAAGTDCAEGGSHIEGTCCAVGDALVSIGHGVGAEVVDLEFDGRYAFLCGGFGVRVNDLVDPAKPQFVGSATSRCQRIAVGPTLADGTRVFYLAHHGDSWVPSPFLGTYHLRPDGGIDQVHVEEDPAVLFEGLAYRDGYLFNAAHDGGLRVYQTAAADGTPTLVSVLGGFGNAWKVTTAGDRAFVADAELGLHVVDISAPDAPTILATAATLAPARDVDVFQDRAYVALGGAGVDVFDVSNSSSPTRITTIGTLGSAQAVAAGGRGLAVAAWSHVALYDTENFALLATEKTRPVFEQDLGVAVHDDLVLVGEWEGLHVLRHRPGFVAPDLHLTEDVITLEPNVSTAHAIVVHNRGMVPLAVGNFSVSAPGFVFDVPALAVAPGESDFFQLSATSLPNGLATTLRFATNDPDPFQALVERAIRVGAVGLGVGSKLTSAFSFLDPNGAGQLAGLEGKVTVLAYFALF